jgi:hypothetical protein
VALSAGATTAAAGAASVGAGAGSVFEQAVRPSSAVDTAIVVNIFISLFLLVFFTLILIK